jgi:hypothetical protein
MTTCLIVILACIWNSVIRVCCENGLKSDILKESYILNYAIETVHKNPNRLVVTRQGFCIFYKLQCAHLCTGEKDMCCKNIGTDLFISFCVHPCIIVEIIVNFIFQKL